MMVRNGKSNKSQKRVSRSLQISGLSQSAHTGAATMTKILSEVTVKGYNRKHKFVIEQFKTGGYSFVRLLKNGNVILNCKESEFDKFRTLFQ